MTAAENAGTSIYGDAHLSDEDKALNEALKAGEPTEETLGTSRYGDVHLQDPDAPKRPTKANKAEAKAAEESEAQTHVVGGVSEDHTVVTRSTGTSSASTAAAVAGNGASTS